jgi:hypothetical protein
MSHNSSATPARVPGMEAWNGGDGRSAVLLGKTDRCSVTARRAVLICGPLMACLPW